MSQESKQSLAPLADHVMTLIEGVEQSYLSLTKDIRPQLVDALANLPLHEQVRALTRLLNLLEEKRHEIAKILQMHPAFYTVNPSLKPAEIFTALHDPALKSSDFAAMLFFLMQKKGIIQNDLARLLGMNHVTIHVALRAKNRTLKGPKIQKLLEWARQTADELRSSES